MAKACDRCEKPIRTFRLTLKVKGIFRLWISNIDLVIQRKREGIDHPEYKFETVAGKIDLCEDCQKSFAKWIDEGTDNHG